MRHGLFGKSALFLAAAIFAGASPPARATLFTGSGTNAETGNSVSGAADITVSGSTLTIILTNTTAGGSLLRGDIMTGVGFDITGAAPTLALTGVAMTDLTDKRFTDKLTSDSTNPLVSNYSTALGVTPQSQYGVSATGFGGAFQNPAGGSGGKNGLVANGTFPAPPGSGLNNSFNTAFPLFQNSLTFTFSITGATITDSQIGNVRLNYGTAGNGVVEGLPPVPEPATIASAGVAIALAGFARLRNRSKKA